MAIGQGGLKDTHDHRKRVVFSGERSPDRLININGVVVTERGG